jgi:membrane protease YdiL (CAAX protease family)
MLPDEADISPIEPTFEIQPPTPPAREPFWGYLDLALVLGLTFALLFLSAIPPLLAFHGVLPTDSPVLLLSSNVVLYAALYLAFRLVFALRYSRPVFSSLGWRRSNFNFWMVGIGGVLLAFSISGLAALVHTPKVPSPIDKLANSPLYLALFGVMAVTLAPLFEELFFRGFIQPLLSRTFGVIAGVLITAALFGSLHGPEYAWTWQYAVAVSLVGAVLGWVRVRTNSTIPSTIMHGCYNAAFVVAFVISKHEGAQ